MERLPPRTLIPKSKWGKEAPIIQFIIDSEVYRECRSPRTTSLFCFATWRQLSPSLLSQLLRAAASYASLICGCCSMFCLILLFGGCFELWRDFPVSSAAFMFSWLFAIVFCSYASCVLNLTVRPSTSFAQRTMHLRSSAWASASAVWSTGSSCWQCF